MERMSKDAISSSQDGQGGVLFKGLELATDEQPVANGVPRLRRPDRRQMSMRTASLDSMLPEDHQARIVWEYVEGLDLSSLYEGMRCVEGRCGRDATDPRIHMALWLYATLDGVGAARELDRLCKDHVAYQWICGGVSVNYHSLSDFRSNNVELLDKLLTKSVAGLMHEGLVKMNRVAQDGIRVRASAGTSSFRRGETLERLESEARQQVQALRQELQGDASAASRRQQRIARARQVLPDVEQRKRDKKDQARASTTDPDARFIKMSDGGVRPAYNVQFATDTESQIITGVDVGNIGSDMGQMGQMIDQHKDRYGRPPGEMLADGGFASRDDIDSASTADEPTVIYAPVQISRKTGTPCYDRQPADTDAVAQWRERMATPEAKDIYKQRASTAECVNALARNRGLQQFLVRGLRKIRAVALWFALAHNLARSISLRRQLALAAG